MSGWYSNFVALLGALAIAACSAPQTPGEPTDDAGNSATPVTCPSSLRGPPVVRVDTASGATYCMDQRETTAGEYKAFLAAKKDDTSGQPTECEWNTTYHPQYQSALDDSSPGYKCAAADPFPTDDEPMNCIDFCDALAYCEWADKRLCGRVGGTKKWGRVDLAAASTVADYTEVNDMAHTTAMEFVDACTQGGKTKYPYGDTYEAGRCIDSKGDAGTSVTDLANRHCNGTTPPYSSIYDLSGSVTEWQNLCLPGMSCYMAGASVAALDASEFACNGSIGHGIAQAASSVVGIRCCADPVPVAKP